MKRIWLIAAAIILVVIIGLATAPFLVPASLYKDRIETAASEALGREVTLEGDVKLSLIPRIEARTGRTVIANPEGFGEAPFAQMSELRTAVKLFPLLSRSVEIDEFVLVDPEINLIRLESGEANWEIGTPSETPAPEQTEVGTGGGDVSAVLGDVRIVNGAVTYDDRQAGVSHNVESLDISVKMDALNKPLTFDGDAIFDGMPIDLDARLENIEAMLDGTPSAVSVDLSTDILTGEISGAAAAGEAMSLDLAFDVVLPSITEAAAFFDVTDLPAAAALGRAEVSGQAVGAPGDLTIEELALSHQSDLLTASLNGEARIADEVSFTGDIDLNAPDLRALAASADAELPPGDIYRAFALSGAASGRPDRISLSNAQLMFDDITASGAATLSLSGKPKLTGELSTPLLDATPYAAASSGETEAEPTSQGGGWGDAPIDLTPLQLIDAELDITADALKFQNWDIGQSVLEVTLNNGRLVADLKRTSLYGGAGTATITADGRNTTPRVGVKANLQGLDIESFLAAAANFDRVEGGGGVEVNIAGEGATMDTLMNSLAGAGSFAFADGAIRGVNLAQLVRSAQEALTAGALPTALSDEAETDFTDMTGSFTVANGVASTDDFALLSPFLTVEGGGQLDIGGQSLDFTLTPKSTDGSSGIGGLGVPVKLAGSWSDVGVGLDTDGLASQATEAVTQELTNELSNALGGVLGGGDDEEEDGDGEEEDAEDRVRNALGGLFDR